MITSIRKQYITYASTGTRRRVMIARSPQSVVLKFIFHKSPDRKLYWIVQLTVYYRIDRSRFTTYRTCKHHFRGNGSQWHIDAFYFYWSDKKLVGRCTYSHYDVVMRTGNSQCDGRTCELRIIWRCFCRTG